MRILFALPYGPTETRVRARMLLDELAGRHEITLLGLAWDQRDADAFDAFRARCAVVEVVPHGRSARVRGMAGDPRRPLQTMVSTSAPFARRARALIAAAERRGQPFDVVHVEHLRGAAAIDLTSRIPVRTVYDAVDCIAELARLTATNAPGRVVRGIARFEQPRTARYESLLLEAADVVTVVAERDRDALRRAAPHARARVVPNGVRTLARPADLTAEPIAVFSGKLSYHANQAAARLLLDDIWPRIQAGVPAARLVIAGSDPPDWLSRRAGCQGVRVIADPLDMLAVISSCRIALAPIVYSVGIQNKVLEAMACGLPVVVTRNALAGLNVGAESVVSSAADSMEFALQAIGLLTDDGAARDLGRGGYEHVTRWHSWDTAARAFEDLYRSPSLVDMVA